MKIYLTRRAERNYNTIRTYIDERFGKNITDLFIKKSDELFELLKAYPLLGQIEKKDIRGFQLSPQTRILYRVKGQTIIVLAFFDVRQNPAKKFK